MLAIVNATVPDGSGKKISVLVDGGKIAASGTDVAVPPGASVINAEGLYILPGLIDAHSHFGGSSSFDRPGCGDRRETYDYVEAREGFLRWGVTTVRTCGDQAKEILPFRDDVNAGNVLSPRVVSCGPFFQGAGGHPWATVYMKDPTVAETAAVFISDDTDIEKAVADVASTGVDFIKAFYGHINKLDYPKPVPHMGKGQLGRLVAAAHKHGLKCAVHVDGPQELMEAVEVGADAIEHLIAAGGEETRFTPAQIEAIKASGAVVDPTMISILRFDQTPGFPSVWADLKLAVKQFYDAGVPLAVGCDSGIPFVPFGESLHDEMACLVEAGIPALDVLNMATEGNARLLGLDAVIGTLDAGKDADLLLLGADPLEDIANTRDIRLTMVKGSIVTARCL